MRDRSGVCSKTRLDIISCFFVFPYFPAINDSSLTLYFGLIGSLDPKAKHVEKVLDVQQGDISYLVGTVYMDMKLKPNILDDITKDVSRIAPLCSCSYSNMDVYAEKT